MLGLSVGLAPQYPASQPVAFPAGFSWDEARYDIGVMQSGGRYWSDATPRDLVDPAIWSGPAFHVDRAGSDANSGLGAFDGDFANAKRTIHAAFVAGNATGGPYRVIVNAGEYKESEFTRNGNDEPSQPVALLAWGGRVRYRTGPFDVSWSDQGGTYSASVSAVSRVFRTDVVTPEGLFSELTEVSDAVACAANVGTFAKVGSALHVNIGGAPGPRDIAVMRGFHGARFLDHTDDFYIEGFDIEGGITGALHCDRAANRNVVGVDCTFRYSAPSNPAAAQDAVRIRRTNGLAAFFECDASCGAKDGWNFHEDGAAALHVLLENCTSYRNGAFGATSVNGFTIHDSVRATVLGGDFGHSIDGSEVHIIQDAELWMAGSSVVGRNPAGDAVAIQCSNQSQMWLQDVRADAAGSAVNFALEANGGTVFERNFIVLNGDIEVYSGGSLSPF